MMQTQNASLFLGLMPNPSSNQPEVNLELARLFIDQLSMIQEKTRGNLTTEETGVLRNALTHLQMAFVEASQGGGTPAAGGKPREEISEEVPPTSEAPAQEIAASGEQPENRKRFSKSYGG